MKKYAIIIGENNPELSRKAQKALFAAGFTWTNNVAQGSFPNKMILFVNYTGRSKIHYRGEHERINGAYPAGEALILSPSYVIAHAAELDGAEKPWEVAPEGRKFVTEEERMKYEMPECVKTCSRKRGGGWGNDWSWTWRSKRCLRHTQEDYVAFAVPIDFTFEPRKVTMAQVCAEFGEDVVIEKGGNQ